MTTSQFSNMASTSFNLNKSSGVPYSVGNK